MRLLDLSSFLRGALFSGGARSQFHEGTLRPLHRGGGLVRGRYLTATLIGPDRRSGRGIADVRHRRLRRVGRDRLGDAGRLVEQIGGGRDVAVRIFRPDVGSVRGQPVLRGDGVGRLVGVDAAVGQLGAGPVGGGAGLGGVHIPPGADLIRVGEVTHALV